MADAIMGSTETTNIAQDKIANLVQSYLVQEAKLLPLITNYSFMVMKGDKSLALPRSGGFTVLDKAENTALDAEAITYTKDVIQLTVHKAVQFLVEKFASRQSVPEILADMMQKAGKDLALSVDVIIATQLLDAAVGNTIDFNDGTNDDVELADFLNIREKLLDNNLEPQECFVGLHPAKEKEALAIDNFIDASKYGASEPIMNGEIGKVYGLRIVVSSVFENDSMVAWHPSAIAFAFAQEIQVATESDLAHLATRYSLDYICGCTEVDGGLRQVKVAPVA